MLILLTGKGGKSSNLNRLETRSASVTGCRQRGQSLLFLPAFIIQDKQKLCPQAVVAQLVALISSKHIGQFPLSLF
jgi:hypothetical protein